MSDTSEKEKDGPRRIVKKKGGHAAHHGGAWKVAYADFVTAMMALFIVLWIVGQSKSTKEAVSGYFKDPTNFSKGGSPGGLGSLRPLENWMTWLPLGAQYYALALK